MTRSDLSLPRSLLITHWGHTGHLRIAHKTERQSTDREPRTGSDERPSGVSSATTAADSSRRSDARETPTSRRSDDERPAPTVATGHPLLSKPTAELGPLRSPSPTHTRHRHHHFHWRARWPFDRPRAIVVRPNVPERSRLHAKQPWRARATNSTSRREFLFR